LQLDVSFNLLSHFVYSLAGTSAWQRLPGRSKFFKSPEIGHFEQKISYLNGQSADRRHTRVADYTQPLAEEQKMISFFSA
jgi:hypothetical protein